MKTDQPQEPAPIFAQIVSVALNRLKKRLKRYYQKAYPDSGEIIRRMIDEEEAKAWEISFFPLAGESDRFCCHFSEAFTNLTATTDSLTRSPALVWNRSAKAAAVGFGGGVSGRENELCAYSLIYFNAFSREIRSALLVKPTT
jgi:hypothetical protein